MVVTNNDATLLSNLSRKLTKDGVSIQVCIYRETEIGPWRLKIVDQHGDVVVWNAEFRTDQAASEEVNRAIEIVGISVLAGL